MERPKEEDYEYTLTGNQASTDYAEFSSALELYIDYLESINGGIIPFITSCDHRYYSKNGRYMLYEGWCEKCGSECNET